MLRTDILRGSECCFKSRFAPSVEEFHKRIDALPNDVMLDCGAKLYPLMNLSWGYVETVVGLCRELRLEETKKLGREIKELKRNYDQFRQSEMGDRETMQEEESGAWIEETFGVDFDRLFVSIDIEASKVCSEKGHRQLCVAVHQALTLIEAVVAYARKCDARIRAAGAWVCDCCMVQSAYLKMIPVLRRYPTAKDERFKGLREMSARILANRLDEIEVSVKEGAIWMETKR